MKHVYSLEMFERGVAARQRGRSTTDRARLAAIYGAIAIGAFGLGSIVNASLSAQTNHSRGACMALEFAEHFATVGATQKRQTMRALIAPNGRNDGLFPKTIEAFEQFCLRIWDAETPPTH